MRGLKSEELEGLLDFCYFGEASIAQKNLDSFMVLAEELQIMGLADHNDEKKTTDVDEHLKRDGYRQPRNNRSRSGRRIATNPQREIQIQNGR